MAQSVISGGQRDKPENHIQDTQKQYFRCPTTHQQMLENDADLISSKLSVANGKIKGLAKYCK